MHTFRRYRLRLINFYPPFLGAGIRVKKISPEIRRFEIKMKLRWWNKNYVGVHFGGSLYAMCDPFYMLILIENLGNQYIVWDKSSTIEFLRPASGAVSAVFEIQPSEIESIQDEIKRARKTTRHYETYIIDENENRIALVKKEIYIRAAGRLAG